MTYEKKWQKNAKHEIKLQRDDMRPLPIAVESWEGLVNVWTPSNEPLSSMRIRFHVMM